MAGLQSKPGRARSILDLRPGGLHTDVELEKHTAVHCMQQAQKLGRPQHRYVLREILQMDHQSCIAHPEISKTNHFL